METMEIGEGATISEEETSKAFSSTSLTWNHEKSWIRNSAIELSAGLVYVFAPVYYECEIYGFLLYEIMPNEGPLRIRHYITQTQPQPPSMSRSQQSHNSHASASSAFSYQSKPSLLAGVQDAYWSDDEEVSGDRFTVQKLCFLL